MTWIKLADNTTRHPKVSRLSDKAFRFWIASLCYAGEFLTDGVVPVTFLLTVKRAIQDEILDAGLWEVRPDGAIAIHDYLEHQRNKATVQQQRDRNKERQHRHRNGVTNGVSNAHRNGVSNALVTGLEEKAEAELEKEKKEPTPKPPSEERSVWEGRFNAWWQVYPKKQGKTDAIKAWRKLNPSAELLDKMIAALGWQVSQPQWTKEAGQFIPNPATYLNRGGYLDEPFDLPAERRSDRFSGLREFING